MPTNHLYNTWIRQILELHPVWTALCLLDQFLGYDWDIDY